MNKDYAAGSVIKYRAFGNELRTVKVDERESDIKNGRPGFFGTQIKDGEVKPGLDCWGYDDQIVEVITK